jgi:hypothetical protein
MDPKLHRLLNVTTNHIENFWGRFKKAIRHAMGYPEDYYHLICQEWMYRQRTDDFYQIFKLK